eukprot:scaffold2668_cov115-Isochrysis_galbana.AAC.6
MHVTCVARAAYSTPAEAAVAPSSTINVTVSGFGHKRSQSRAHPPFRYSAALSAAAPAAHVLANGKWWRTRWSCTSRARRTHQPAYPIMSFNAMTTTFNPISGMVSSTRPACSSMMTCRFMPGGSLRVDSYPQPILARKRSSLRTAAELHKSSPATKMSVNRSITHAVRRRPQHAGKRGAPACAATPRPSRPHA